MINYMLLKTLPIQNFVLDLKAFALEQQIVKCSPLLVGLLLRPRLPANFPMSKLLPIS